MLCGSTAPSEKGPAHISRDKVRRKHDLAGGSGDGPVYLYHNGSKLRSEQPRHGSVVVSCSGHWVAHDQPKVACGTVVVTVPLLIPGYVVLFATDK